MDFDVKHAGRIALVTEGTEGDVVCYLIQSNGKGSPFGKIARTRALSLIRSLEQDNMRIFEWIPQHDRDHISRIYSYIIYNDIRPYVR